MPDPLSSRTPPPPTPLPRGLRSLLALFCILGAACLSAFAFIPRDTEAHDAAGNLTQVSILHPALAEALSWLLLAGFLLLLAAAIILLVRKQFIVGTLFLLAIILVSLFSTLRGIVGNLAPWIIYDQTLAADGTQYCFIDSSFLQGQTMAIARTQSAGRFYRTLDVLGSTNGDSPRSYLLVVRPTPPKPIDYGALYSTPDHRLILGLRQDNACYLAYDIANHRFIGHGDIEKLSPFLLIDDKTPLHAPDEATILEAIGKPDTMGIPTRAALTPALTHPNPAVRQSAANILKAMNP